MESNLVQDLTALRNLPSSWKVEAFNKVVSDISGGNKKTQKSDFLENGDIAVIDQGKELIAGYVNDQDLIVKNLPPYIVFGDHTRIFKFIDFPFAMGADGTKVIKLINDKKDNLRYIFYFFNSLNIPNTGYNRHYKYLKDVKIPLPSFATQQKIAAILDAADELRQKDKALVAKYDELTQALFIDMFGDIINNQKRWELVNFGSIFNSIRYGTSTPPIYSEEGIPFIRATNVKNGTVALKGMVYISEDEASKISKCKLKEGDIIIVRSGANTGDSCRIPKSYANSYGGFDLIIEINEPFSTFYNFLINTKAGKKILEPLTRRAGQPHLNSKQISDLLVLNPPINLQNQFAERLHAIEEQKNIAQASALKSEELFNSLLQKAFNGELV